MISAGKLQRRDFLKLRCLWNEERIRLVGIAISKFSSNLSHQMSLFEDIKEVENNSELDKTIDKLKSTYGNNIIVKASSIKKD